MRPGLIDTLLASDEPSVRWKVRVLVLGEDDGSARVRRLREQISTVTSGGRRCRLQITVPPRAQRGGRVYRAPDIGVTDTGRGLPGSG